MQDLIVKAKEELSKLMEELSKMDMRDYGKFQNKLERWKERAVQIIKDYISDVEGRKFESSEFVQRKIINDYDYDYQDLMYDEATFYMNQLEVLKEELTNHPESILWPSSVGTKGSWDQFFRDMHPTVRKISQQKFNDGHYADAVESAFKEINDQVKKLYHIAKGLEKDGRDLMMSAFSEKDPAVKLTDLSNMSEINIQKGFKYIFAGSIVGIRNPKAHSNVSIPPSEAIHMLFLASLLFKKIDERK